MLLPEQHDPAATLMMGRMDHTRRDAPSKEDAMNRFLIAVAAAIFAVSAMFAPSAQAGFKGRLAIGLAIGAIALSHQHAYEEQRWKKRRYYARHKEAKKVYAGKKSSPSTEAVAKAEPEPTVEKDDAMIESENSSISTAAIGPVEQTAAMDDAKAAPEPVSVAAEGSKTVKKLDCKKFFPAAGMTLSVSCE
jgi:hypothetical protein